jgi:hypothetical protein
MRLGFLLAAVFGLLLQNVPDSTGARVEGTVINQVTKEPVERVEVRFTSRGGRRMLYPPTPRESSRSACFRPEDIASS